MSVYSNLEIKAAIEQGHIVVDPFDVSLINGSSVDVRLGEYFYHSGYDEGASKTLYNPYDPDDVARHFGELKRALPLREHSTIIKKLGIKTLTNIPEDHPVIILRPHERILAHTHEFIGILPPGTTSMQARSTTGRNGIVVCMDAGWGDPGYVNRWTMEIKNMNEQYTVLPIGIRIAQIVFQTTGDVEGEYASLSGKYQTISGHKLEEIKANWHPEQMLPKAYKDELKILMPIEDVYSK